MVLIYRGVSKKASVYVKNEVTQLYFYNNLFIEQINNQIAGLITMEKIVQLAKSAQLVK